MALKDDIANLPAMVGEGSAGHLGNHQVLHAAAKDHEARLATMESRASITWSYEGTGTPSLSSYPGIKIGDYIVRKSDGQEWRVDP